MIKRKRRKALFLTNISMYYKVNYIKNNNEVSLKFVYDSNSV